MKYSDLQPHLQREFNYSETIQVLKSNKNVYYSWGTSKISLVDVDKQDKNYVKGLLLSVSGRLHKGYVLITLGFDDTYCVYIMNNRGRVLDTHKDVYVDMLVDVIDYSIETK